MPQHYNCKEDIANSQNTYILVSYNLCDKTKPFKKCTMDNNYCYPSESLGKRLMPSAVSARS